MKYSPREIGIVLRQENTRISKVIIKKMLLSNGFTFKQLGSSLVGMWNVRRAFTGENVPFKDEFFGKAVFTNMGSYLEYNENMLFPIGGVPIKAKRKYCYLFSDDLIEMYFNYDERKGDLFLSLLPTIEKTNEQVGDGASLYLIRAAANHLCGNDNYKGELIFYVQVKDDITDMYTFKNCKQFQTIYTINGPCKNYVIWSEFSH
jgi:hypothetical protein